MFPSYASEIRICCWFGSSMSVQLLTYDGHEDRRTLLAKNLAKGTSRGRTNPGILYQVRLITNFGNVGALLFSAWLVFLLYSKRYCYTVCVVHLLV